jgi:hypothetical protein
VALVVAGACDPSKYVAGGDDGFRLENVCRDRSSGRRQVLESGPIFQSVIMKRWRQWRLTAMSPRS